MKNSLKYYSKDDKPIKTNHQYTADKHSFDITGKLKKEVKELNNKLHHFIVDWQSSEVPLPKN